MCRGFLNDTDKLTFCTDLRSRKIAEIKNSARAQICWYFTDSREQFRLDGSLQIVGPDDDVLNEVRTLRRRETSSQQVNAGYSNRT